MTSYISAPKSTCCSGTLDGLETLDGLKCLGAGPTHTHKISYGKDASGRWRSRRFQTYPPQLALAIAQCTLRSMQRMLREGSGPSGYMHCENTKKTTSLGAESGSAGDPAVSLLNKDVVVRRHVLLGAWQSALYLHIDDTVTFSLAEQAATRADALMLKSRMD